MGFATAELWNNLGLCCFHASQYDMCLICFERALALSEDNNSADIWYNVGQLAIGIGDLGLAYQAFKIAVSVDMNHAESFNNLGVLELRKHNPEAARSNFEGSHKLSEFHFGPLLPAHVMISITSIFGKATTNTSVPPRLCVGFTLSLRHFAIVCLFRAFVQRCAVII